MNKVTHFVERGGEGRLTKSVPDLKNLLSGPTVTRPYEVRSSITVRDLDVFTLF